MADTILVSYNTFHFVYLMSRIGDVNKYYTGIKEKEQNFEFCSLIRHLQRHR